MSQYGQRVVAIVEPTSTFATQVNSLFTDVTQLTSRMDTLTANAPEVLDTLKEIADAINTDPAFFTTMATANTTLQTNIDAEGTTRTAAVAALQGLIDAATAARTALSGRLDTLEADSTTATAVATAIAAVQADVNQNETDADTAIAGVQADLATETTARGVAIAALQADVDTNEADADTAIALKFDKAGGTLTGSLAIAKSFPDVELKAGNEKRILFSDAGGGSTAAIKHVSTTLDFFAGGIAGSNKEMSIGTDGVDVSALKIGGTAVTATAAEINAFDGRLDTLEADPTTATALAAVQADVNQNETDADAADLALSNRLDTLEADPTTATALAAVQADVDQNEADADAADTALGNRIAVLEADPTTATDLAAVQADIDQNESDADAAIALKANLSGAAFTGDVSTTGNLDVAGNLQIDNDGGYYIHFDRNTATQLDLATGNIPSGGNLNIKNSNGTDARVVVYSDEFWVRALGGVNGNGKAKFDGDVTFGDGLIVSGGLTDAADDGAAATAGVAVGQLYRNGSVVMIRVS